MDFKIKSFNQFISEQEQKRGKGVNEAEDFITLGYVSIPTEEIRDQVDIELEKIVLKEFDADEFEADVHTINLSMKSQELDGDNIYLDFTSVFMLPKLDGEEVDDITSSGTLTVNVVSREVNIASVNIKK